MVEVDVARKRIALTMKLDATPARRDAPRENRFEGAGRGLPMDRHSRPQQPATTDGAMAQAFLKLKK